MEYNINEELNEDDILPKKPGSYPKSAKIIIIVLSIIVFLLILTIILAIALKKDDSKDKDSSNQKEEKPFDLISFYRTAFGGEILYNQTYAEGEVENTFRKGGANHKDLIGDINDNKNYTATKYNIYDLYLPYTALQEKKTKGILVFIHGGAWFQGSKEEMTYLAQIYYEKEFIVINLDYTLITEEDNTTNLYRQLDEISACINHVKNYLVSRGFKESELQVAVSGGSAGGHLSLLYGYLVNNRPLEVKFINDCIGPVNLDIDDYLLIQNDNDTLPDIEPKTVEEALKHREKYVQPMVNDVVILKFLNYFVGCKYTNELQSMLKDGKIDKNNEKYKELYDKAKYGFPINWMEGKNIPIFAFYGGKDRLIGFVQFSRLREAANKYGNTLEIVYSRYGDHALSEFEHKEGIKAAKDFHYTMLKFSDKYFTKY